MSEKKSCCVCGQPFVRIGLDSYKPCCENCEGIYQICHTSVEDGICGAKASDNKTLEAAFRYELIRAHSRKSLRVAIAREIGRRMRQAEKAKA